MSFVHDQIKTIVKQNPRPKVMGISGSPRKGGNSDTILKHILASVTGNRIPTESFQLSTITYQGCIGCEKCRKTQICAGLKDGMSLIYPDIIESQGLVLVSPTHNYNVTAWMKAFIDRLYCFYLFDNNRPRGWSSLLAGQKRKAVIAAICEQENKEDMGFTLDAMRLPLQALGYEVIVEFPVFNIFDKGKVKDHSAVLKEAHQIGAKLAESL